MTKSERYTLLLEKEMEKEKNRVKAQSPESRKAAEQAMAKLKEAREALDAAGLAILEAKALMLENGLGLPENRAEISKADIEVINLGCLIHPTIIRGL